MYLGKNELRVEFILGWAYLIVDTGDLYIPLHSIKRVEIAVGRILFHMHVGLYNIKHTPKTFKQLDAIVKEYGHLMNKENDQ